MTSFAAAATHHRLPRAMQAAPALALPTDVRLMQGTANAIFVLGGLVLLAAAALWAARLPMFSLRVIKVEGEFSRSSESTIRANAAPKLKGNFVTMDLRQARRAFEAVPWVRQAVVRRVWPMGLAVQLQEHRPLALWAAADGNDKVVNSYGEVFEVNTGDVEDEALPSLAGPDGSARQMLAMQQRLAPLLAQLGAGDLSQLSLSARGSWRADLDKGAVLELGRGNDAELLARTTRFVATMPRVMAAYRRPLQSADLRHQGGFAVRMHGVTTQAPAATVKKK